LDSKRTSIFLSNESDALLLDALVDPSLGRRDWVSERPSAEECGNVFLRTFDFEARSDDGFFVWAGFVLDGEEPALAAALLEGVDGGFLEVMIKKKRIDCKGRGSLRPIWIL